jgi:hypothetical protein
VAVPTRARSLSAVLITVVLAVILLSVSTGSAKAYGVGPPSGFVTPDGSFVELYERQLLGDGSVNPGSLVFGDVIDVIFFNVLGNRTVQVESYQNGSSIGHPSLWLNESYTVPGHTFSVFSFTLPSSAITLPTRFCVDGGCMDFLHETPITWLPSGILSIGGVDLVAFAVTSETLILMVPLTIWARTLTHRARWTPKANWWLILPHVAFAVVLLVSVEYPLLDETFAGLEFVLFPIVIALLFFFFVMHLFNVASPAEADQVAPDAGHKVRLTKWWILIGVFPDGRWGIIGTRWRDWIARLFGHFPVIFDPTDHDPTKVMPASSAVTNRTVGDPWEYFDPQSARWRSFRSLPGRETPLESFPVTNVTIKGVDVIKKRELPIYQFWVDHDQWLTVRLPYMSVHREKDVPPKLSPEGAVLVPATKKNALTWPHYVDPPALVSLADVHWMDALAAWLGWQAQERAYKLVEETRRENYALQTGVYLTADGMTKVSMGEVFELLERERFPIKLERAKEEVQRPGRRKDDRGSAQDEDEGAPKAEREDDEP